MSDHAPQREARPRWRCRRALAFALVSSLVGAIGHSALGGQLPDLRVLLVAVPVLTVYAWVFTDTRQRWWAITAGVALVQAGFHAAMMFANPTAHDMSSHAHGSELHGAAAASGMSLAMLAVHVAAVLLGVVVLLGIERRAWNVAKRVVHRVRTWFAPDTTVAPVATSGRASITAVPSTRHLLPTATRWLVDACGFRGPPSVQFA